MRVLLSKERIVGKGYGKESFLQEIRELVASSLAKSPA